jgi:hypothetical protein
VIFREKNRSRLGGSLALLWRLVFFASLRTAAVISSQFNDPWLAAAQYFCGSSTQLRAVPLVGVVNSVFQSIPISA